MKKITITKIKYIKKYHKHKIYEKYKEHKKY